jgi:hypothetical protein
VQVPVEDTAQRRLLRLRRLLAPRLGAGVRAQQVVELEAVGRGLLQQVRPDQDIEQLPRPADRDPGQRGGRVQPYLRARMQAEQPEEPGRVGRQGSIGPGEDGAHRVGLLLVAGSQQAWP